MAQREWVEKDFYKELGVSSDASADEIKTGLPQVGLAICIPTRTPTTGGRDDSRRCPRRTACCRTRPSARNTTKPDGCSPAAASVGGRFDSGGDGDFGGFGGDGAEFNLNDLFDAAGQTGGANIGDLFGGLFGRGAQQPRPSRPRRGNDLETETELASSRPPRAWRCRCG